jgi:uncharacterized protein YjbI with pentapeptide repeats
MYSQLTIALNNRRLHWFYCLCSNATTNNNSIYQANIYQANIYQANIYQANSYQTNIYQTNIYQTNNSNSYLDRASSMQSSWLAQLLTILFFNT